jgi:hypothetical protein
VRTASISGFINITLKSRIIATFKVYEIKNVIVIAINGMASLLQFTKSVNGFGNY